MATASAWLFWNILSRQCDVVAQRVVFILILSHIHIHILRWHFVGYRGLWYERWRAGDVSAKRFGIIRLQVELAAQSVKKWMSVTVFLPLSLPLSIPFSPWICTVAHEGASIAHTAIANVLRCFAAFAGKGQRLPYALYKVFPGALMTAANWEREGTTEQQSVSQSTLSIFFSTH